MSGHLLTLTADIVAAHVEHNDVGADVLPDMVRAVHQALATVAVPPSSAEARRAQEPAVPIRRSVFPDYIVCLEDGRKLKVLKRHLRVNYGMTPHQYRVKWGLPPDYPMVAPTYAEYRSAQSRSYNLGKTGVAGKQRES